MRMRDVVFDRRFERWLQVSGLNRGELATMVDDAARRRAAETDAGGRARAVEQWLCGRTAGRAVPPLLLDVLNEYAETVLSEASEGMRGAAMLRRTTDALIESATAADPAGRSSPTARLTDREREILFLIGTALSNRQIAGRLKISEKTVKNHITSIFAKLGVSARSQAIVVALRTGASTVGHDYEATRPSVRRP